MKETETKHIYVFFIQNISIPEELIYVLYSKYLNTGRRLFQILSLDLLIFFVKSQCLLFSFILLLCEWLYPIKTNPLVIDSTLFENYNLITTHVVPRKHFFKIRFITTRKFRKKCFLVTGRLWNRNT